jgi:hypothetical protein
MCPQLKVDFSIPDGRCNGEECCVQRLIGRLDRAARLEAQNYGLNTCSTARVPYGNRPFSMTAEAAADCHKSHALRKAWNCCMFSAHLPLVAPARGS